MITETATVIEVGEDTILVETVQQSTCGACAAQKGCGQGVLAKYLSSSSFFRVQLPEPTQTSSYRVGDTVELGIDELAMVRASLWLYIVPLAGLLMGAYLGNLQSEVMSVFLAIVGLMAGGYLSSRHARRTKNSPEYAPVLLADTSRIRILDLADPA